jgi:hypothetical protein
MHALSTLMSPQSLPSDMSIKLRELAQAHSRFVLLLQSLAHSSSSPMSEIENIPWSSSFPPAFKELHFPAPLSYHELGLRNSSVISIRNVSTTRTKKSNVAPGPARLRKGNSIFRSSKPRPPPPSSDPALRQYSDTWRRSLRPSLWALDEFGNFKSQRPQLASDDFSSDAFSLTPSTRFAASDRDHSPLGARYTSPHDFELASSRAHAPVLRVFVPCTTLDDTSIAACEDQLIDAGLWTHLSEGDIVCNLGYVPPKNPEPATNEDSCPLPSALWLLFDGSNLVPYSPSDPPPVRDVLTLPSPFYYSHILPPLSNPTFVLDLPPHLSLPNSPRPQFSLAPVMTKVKSPRSTGGFAMVKQYKWLAILGGPKADVGPVWQTEWIFEGEGTTEGKRLLNELITRREKSNERWVWEIEREKCSQTRIWFK